MRTQPKKNLTIVNRYKGKRGNAVRIGYQNRILEKAPIFPKPLEYDDIDKAIFDFVDTLIPIVVDGKLIPTYTLYSNQRFSEYTQIDISFLRKISIKKSQYYQFSAKSLLSV